MNILKSFTELRTIIETDEPVIVYGAGCIGRLLIESLELCGCDERIDFIAVKELDDNPTTIGDIPVISIESLSLYRKSRVVIATELCLAEKIEVELVQLGYEKTFCLSGSITDELRNNEWETKKKLETKRIDSMIRRLSNMECKIEQQNEVSEYNSLAFSDMKNVNTGKDVVVFASGPSASLYKPIAGAIHIGVNRAWYRDDIKFDYYFIQDACGGNTNPMLPLLETDILDCPLFVGTYLKRHAYYSSEFSAGYEVDHDNVRRYYIDCVFDRKERGYRYYPNICHHPLLDFGSITFPAIQFAMFTNPRKLFLVGCDATYGQNAHFFDSNSENAEVENILPACWEIGYTQLKEYARLYYPNMEIISINPVNLKGLFKDIYT